VEGTVSGSTDRGDLSVLELNSRVSSLLDTAFPYPVWVRGEVAGDPTPGRRGHTYFQLIEPSSSGGFPEASINCALFAGSKSSVVREFARLGETFQLQEGMAIRALGRVNLWPKGGRYQFIVQSIDAAWTQGTQARRLRELADRLRRAGVLAANSSRSLPRLPLSVGLVTSRGSAAARDFIQTLEESGYPFSVAAAWAAMQGRETSSTVTSALAALSSTPGLDAVVITRGGGSSTDLGWMNDESIARAIAACPYPVISGIGHEVDTTLPDLAASVRAKTPTHAASLLVDMAAEFEADLSSLAALLQSRAVPALRSAAADLRRSAVELQRTLRMRTRSESAAIGAFPARLAREAKHLLRVRRSELGRLAGTTAGMGLAQRLDRLRDVLEDSRRSLAVRTRDLLRSEDLRLEKLLGRVERRDPERILELGWAIARHGDGSVIRSVGELSPGDGIDLRLRDGSVSARAEEIRPEGER
jgi:exodeoxyribonuclease VII large subunit